MDCACNKLKKRIEWVDSAKGIGILLVMLGHCYLDEIFTFWFCSFHMPLFFFLSGITFSGKDTYGKFFLKKVRTLLVPYLFFAIVTMLCNGVLAITHGNTYDVVSIVLQYIIQKRYTLLWFITCLFVAEQLMYGAAILCRRHEEKKSFFIFAICGVFIFTVYRMVVGIDLPWNIDLAILAFAFMCLGKACSKFLLYDCKCKKVMVIVTIGVIWFVCSWVNYRYFGKTDWFSNDFGNPILFLFAAIAGTIFTVLVCQRIKSPILAKLGANSLVFYGLHRIVIDNLFVIFNKLGLSFAKDSILAFVLSIVVVFAGILILIPVNFIIMKYFPWIIGKRIRKND